MGLELRSRNNRYGRSASAKTIKVLAVKAARVEAAEEAPLEFVGVRLGLHDCHRTGAAWACRSMDCGHAGLEFLNVIFQSKPAHDRLPIFDKELANFKQQNSHAGSLKARAVGARRSWYFVGPIYSSQHRAARQIKVNQTTIGGLS